MEESVGFQGSVALCSPWSPLAARWLLKPVFVSSVRVNKDRMPLGKEWKEPSLFQRQTPAIMLFVLDARHQPLAPYPPVM